MRNKKKWRKLAAIVLSAALLVPTHAVYAEEGKEIDAQLEADAEGFLIKDGELISYIGRNKTKVVVPDSVTSIGDGAFGHEEDITEISLPAGLVRIGERAFRDCSGLTEIHFPEGLKEIGSYAFENQC